MIENFSDFLSVILVANLCLYGIYLGLHSLQVKRHRNAIKKEIKYYRNIG